MVSSGKTGVSPKYVTRQDVERARELYRYWAPRNRNRSLPSSLDTAITSIGIDNFGPGTSSVSDIFSPYCQMIALRCDATKVMINLIDIDTIHFVAEASRPRKTDLSKDLYDFVESPILKVGTSSPLKGNMCESTVRMRSASKNSVPMFAVSDLLESPFLDSNIVQALPHYRFYAGTPLTTKSGINIGSLAFMDDQPRAGLTYAEERLLAETAAQVMALLNICRKAVEGQRAMRMVQSFKTFLVAEGRSVDSRKQSNVSNNETVEHDTLSIPEVQPESTDTPSSHLPTSIYPSLTRQKKSEDLLSTSSTEVSIMSSPSRENEKDSHVRTFARGANFLRQGLHIGHQGSVLFYSLSSSHGSRARRLPPSHETGLRPEDIVSPHLPSETADNVFFTTNSVLATPIAASTASIPRATILEMETQDFPLSDLFLEHLTNNYPEGRLWSLKDADSLQENDNVQKRSAVSDTSWHKYEAQALRAVFPLAQDILFAPLFDSNADAFAHGVFVVSTLATRRLDLSSDLPLIQAFCGAIMAKNSRTDIGLAEKQKSDFVGTISHELRSPLHGIFASAEMLRETGMTSHQNSLIDAVESCGRTLLETVDHVLDFSKINALQRRMETTSGSNLNPSSQEVLEVVLPHEGVDEEFASGRTTCPVDIANIVEEVVESLMLGHASVAEANATDISGQEERCTPTQSEGLVGDLEKDSICVVLDFTHADFTFLAPSGAVRRIVLNLVGNALKYTATGDITVGLSLQLGSDSENLILIVCDTGKGISPSFLKSRLFQPFAQENPISPGTGLGLSIVQTIVQMLRGTITVSSEVNVGTTVQVVLPMNRPQPDHDSLETAESHPPSLNRFAANAPNHLGKFSMAFYGSGICSQTLLLKALTSYAVEWCCLSIVVSAEQASVVVVDESDLHEVVDLLTSDHANPALMVLCDTKSRTRILRYSPAQSSIIETLTKPCGPNKFCKSVQLVLDRLSFGENHPIPATISQRTKLDNGMLTPGSEEVDTAAAATQPVQFQINKAKELTSHMQTDSAPTLSRDTPDLTLRQHQELSPSSSGRYSSQMSDAESKLPQLNITTDYQTTESVGSVISKRSETSLPVQSRSVPTTIPEHQINPRILLVDDNKINLDLLEFFLRKKRTYADIQRAKDGRQALDTIMSSSTPFQIIFMDISMPIMNGFEATRAIRAAETNQDGSSGALIVALTGLVSFRDQKEGFESGCDVYMTKPVSFKHLNKLLDEWEAHFKSETRPELIARMRSNYRKIISRVETSDV